MLQAISAAPAHPVLRVTENAPPLVKRAMDAGARTLLFPNVNSVAEAQLAAAAMRYPQDGNGGLRGVAAVTRGGRFGLLPDYLLTANEAACTVVQIESAAAVSAAAEIAACHRWTRCSSVRPICRRASAISATPAMRTCRRRSSRWRRWRPHMASPRASWR
jgi:hypothetical protein